MTDEQVKQELTAMFFHLVHAQDFDDFALRVAVVKILARWESILNEWEVPSQ